MELEFHPLANLFPLIEGSDLAELAANIKANGLVEPIDLYQRKILDGRNRWRAAIQAGIELEKRHIRTFRPEIMGDPLAYVISKNLSRRHLNESQRAMVAAKIANLAPGANQHSEGLPIGRASNMTGASQRSTARAREVLSTGAKELQEAVERGHLPVSTAAEVAKLAPERQREIVAAHEPGSIARRALAEVKKSRREATEARLGANQRALPSTKFGVIVADPEWRFEPYSRDTGLDRSPDNHYPTSVTKEIASRDVPSIAADDCVLFLWATVPMLPQALKVLSSWGFTYRSQYIWIKTTAKDELALATGYWNRNCHEILLVGSKGKPPAPAMGTQYPSVLEAQRGVHSAKPEIFLKMIEEYFPTMPKIELNRRGPPRNGWAAWGLEAEPAHDPQTGEIREAAE